MLIMRNNDLSWSPDRYGVVYSSDSYEKLVTCSSYVSAVREAREIAKTNPNVRIAALDPKGSVRPGCTYPVELI
jgi:hypothetical protein